MPNAWVEHVKSFAAQNNVAYGCAISIPACRESYYKSKEAKTAHHSANKYLASGDAVLSQGRRKAMTEEEFMEEYNAAVLPKKHARKMSVPKHVSEMPKKGRKP